MKPEPLPIACTLTAAELPERLAEMRAVGREALIAAGERELRFRPQARERLEAIVAAEAECCSFMTLALGEANGELLLTVEAPPGAEPVVRELVAAFSGRLDDPVVTG
jgi:hypothetical protein